MIGEIRDKETAQIAIRAAITGHLVLSTLHTRDALSSIARLKDLGVEDYLIRSAISLLASQRLVRKLCNCKKADTMTDNEYEIVSQYQKTPRDKIIYRPNGCDKCQNGYLGREAVEEVILVDKELKEILREEGASTSKVKEKLKKEGFKSMLENGIDKVLEGKTSFEEVLGVLDMD